MPWKECSAMDERMQFVARRLAGESMAELCREFGIARKTGYKIFDRYQECGIQGLTDRSRRPHHYAHKLPFQVENYILNVKREHTTWGARKIRDWARKKSISAPSFARQTVGIKEVRCPEYGVNALREAVPAELVGGVWHTTHQNRFRGILEAGEILPEPKMPDQERWGTAGEPEFYPYSRSIVGVSLFDFCSFDAEKLLRSQKD
jgi:transposase